MLAATSTASLEQALFTSVQSDDNEGYQIAACSSGIDEATRRELAVWGPSHDSLQPGMLEAGSINGHALSDGRFCLSLTSIATAEYSGRGKTITTWILLADAAMIETFGRHPLRLFDAALAAGWTNSERCPIETPLQLVGTARPVNLEAVAHACGVFGAETLAAVAERATQAEFTGILVAHHQRALLDALFSLTPLPARHELSFTTALVPVAQRPFRIHFLVADAEVPRAFSRVTSGEVLDLTNPALLARGLSEPGKELARMLKAQRWCAVRRSIASAA